MVKEIAWDNMKPILQASQPPYDFSHRIHSLLNSFTQSQVLLVSVLIGFLYGRGKSLALATAIALAYLCGTWVYLNRLIYVLPYAIGLIASAYRSPVLLKSSAHRVVSHTALASLVVVGITLSLIVRPAIALTQQADRDPRILFELGRDSVGAGSYRIYVDAWEFYFVGRDLGWHMFNEYVDADEIHFSKLLETVDYAIFREENAGPELEVRLAKAGLSFRRQLTMKRRGNTYITQLSNFGAKPYGPYVLYSRRATHASLPTP